LAGQYALKNFKNTTYYSKFNSKVSAQTPLGIRVSGGFDNTAGQFVNPEDNLPIQGLAFAGIEVPLGAGMFTDDGRALVKQKSFEIDGSELINTLEVNDYLLSAGESYWEWYASIMLLGVSQQALNQAIVRRELVNEKFKIGEAAAIDTLEAYINFQNRSAYNLKTRVNFLKKSNAIRDYIWAEDIKNKGLFPLVDLNYNFSIPDSFLTSDMLLNHPAVLLLGIDSMITQVNLALAKEYFKPTVDLNLKLQELPSDFAEFNYSPSENNYVGLNFSMPLFLRKQRAKSRQLQFKNTMISNKKDVVLTKLSNAQNAYSQNIVNLNTSVGIWETATANYKRLLDAENERLTLGESSLFIVNNRELRWIDSQEKYIEAYIEYRITILQYLHSLGILSKAV
jgi:outer membrane protein TolC